jgi:hypothetical protein
MLICKLADALLEGYSALVLLIKQDKPTVSNANILMYCRLARNLLARTLRRLWSTEESLGNGHSDMVTHQGRVAAQTIPFVSILIAIPAVMAS